jgi:ribonuclease HI
MRYLRAYIDGACEPNPSGEAGYGIVIKDETGKTLTSLAGYVGVGRTMTNNVAEYAALVSLFQWLKRNKIDEMGDHLTILSDSEMLVKQMTGKYRVLKGLYVKWWEKAVDELVKLKPMKIYYTHIPRESNTEADRLSHKILFEKGIIDETT